MDRWVEITFDCLPLRAISRLDAPMDASPKLAAKIARIQAALQKHGSHNTYYLHNAKCFFHMTNDPLVGSIEFSFEGTVFTDSSDLKPVRSDLTVKLERETCDWLTQTVVKWFTESVEIAVLVEFARYVAVGDLAKTRERIEKLEKSVEEKNGYLGMYL